nr:hypothetical protein [Tanacetum cinerariifolium]
MVETRNSSLEATINEATRNSVTNHVSSAIIGLDERMLLLTNSINNLMTQHQFVVADVNKLKNGKGTNRFSRLGKMEFPKFFGDDVKGWMYRIKQFFTIYNVTKEDKVKIDSIYMYDRALAWHLQFLRAQRENVTWAVYEEAVLNRFREANEDPMCEGQMFTLEIKGMEDDELEGCLGEEEESGVNEDQLLPEEVVQQVPYISLNALSVLGIQCLSTLGTIKWNFQDLIMEFDFQRKKGGSDQEELIDVDLQMVLDEYKDLFEGKS